MSKPPSDIFTGRLTRDPDIKEKFTALNLAKGEKLQDGTYGPSLFVRAVCFKTAAEDARDLKKGDTVTVHGILKQAADWTNRDGVTMKGGVEMATFKVERFEWDARPSDAPRVDEEGNRRREAPPRQAAPKRGTPKPQDIGDESCPF